VCLVALDNVTLLTVDLLNSESVHDDRACHGVQVISLPIDQAVSLSERRQTDRHTDKDSTDHPTHALAAVGVTKQLL